MRDKNRKRRRRKIKAPLKFFQEDRNYKFEIRQDYLTVNSGKKYPRRTRYKNFGMNWWDSKLIYRKQVIIGVKTKLQLSGLQIIESDFSMTQRTSGPNTQKRRRSKRLHQPNQ